MRGEGRMLGREARSSGVDPREERLTTSEASLAGYEGRKWHTVAVHLFVAFNGFRKP